MSKYREKDGKRNNIFYKGIDITALFLRDYSTLSKGEILTIKGFYKNSNAAEIKNIMIDAKILPFAACVLSKVNCDKEYWDKEHEKFVLRNTQIKDLLDCVFKESNHSKVSSLALVENFGTVLSSNSCIGCFFSGDIDLTANITDKNNIEKCLNKFNFFNDYRSKNAAYLTDQMSMYYNPDAIGGGFWINVMWKPVARSFLIQEKYDKRLNIARSSSIRIDKSNIKVLDNSYLLYFNALHIAAGHYYTLNPGLRLYVDIDRLIRSKDINWDNIKKWSLYDDAGLRIAIVLYLSKKIFKTPIPPSAYTYITETRRGRNLIKYLYKYKSNQIQSKSNKFRRLYLELISDNRNIFYSLFYRTYKLFLS